MSKEIQIRNYDSKKETLDTSMLNSKLPSPWFSWIILGIPGSGKSTLALNIIDWYWNFHDAYIIVSPSISKDEKWLKMIERLIDKDKKVKIFESYSDSVMEQIDILTKSNNSQNIL